MHEKHQLPKKQRRRSFQLRNATAHATRHPPKKPEFESVSDNRNVLGKPRVPHLEGASTLMMRLRLKT
jgi:hypothetical protein